MLVTEGTPIKQENKGRQRKRERERKRINEGETDSEKQVALPPCLMLPVVTHRDRWMKNAGFWG
jgi:hypothetical protein